MSLDKKYIQSSDPYKKITDKTYNVRNVYYGEVVSLNDSTDGGIIKVKILGLDNKITNTEDLADCYPLLPKFFHVYPKIGEVVRIILEDPNYPQRGRFWLGSVISQPQKIEFDSIYTALSTTDRGLTRPITAPTTYPDAQGVFPTKDDVAIVGRENTDVVLRDSQLELRAGKHENDNILKLNTKNPASINLTFEQNENDGEYYSNTVVLSDKIAFISHDGQPKFKAARITPEDRTRIFEEGHPIARADVLVKILEIFRQAIIGHIHGYSALPADKNSIINDLEKINIKSIVQENIVIN